FTFSAATHAYWPGSGSTVYFQGGGSGGFTVTASGSTDATSGLAGYTYPALGSGWSNTGGAYTFDSSAGTQSGAVSAQDNAGNSSSGTSFTAQSDSSAPSSSISCDSAACSASWYTTSPVSIAITGSDAAAGVERIVYTTDGSAPAIDGTDNVTNGTAVAGSSATFNITTLGSTTVKWIVEDNVGNVSGVSSQVVELDTTAPSAPSLSYSGFGHAYYPGSGSTVYFQGGGSGGFTVTAGGSTDSESGVAGYTYPALGSGWSNTAGAYSFSSSAGTQSGSVTAQNNAGLSSAGTSFTAQSDGAAPTSSITCNAAACSASWYTSSPVAVAITGSDSGAGVERVVYTTDGSDPAIDGTDTVTNGTAVTGSSATFNITALGATTVKWIAEDNVGNISTVSSQVVKLDTTPPSAPSLSYSGFGHSYYPGSGSTVYFQGGGTGGFTVTASGSTDAQSGFAGYTYPALGSGWTNTNGDYSFDATAGTQSGSVTAQNNAGLSSAGTSFTAQSDSTAPGSSVTCNSLACSAGWYTTSPVAVAITGSDSGAGVERIVYTTDGSDPAIDGSDAVTNGTEVDAGSANVNVASDGVTTVKWIVEDNVGNVSGVSSQVVHLDTTVPTAPTGFSFSSTTHAYWPGSGSTVYFQGGGTGGFTVTASGSTDATSGVAGYTYPALGTGWTNTNGDYTFDATAGTQSGAVGAQDNAGLSSATTSFTAQSDASAPTSSVSCDSAACSAGWYTTSPVSVAITGNDGGAGVERIVYTTDGSTPAIDGSDTVTNGTEVAGANASFNITTLGTTTVKWIAEDNVGNVSSVSSQTVKLDTTAPSAPSLGFSGLTNAYYPGSGTTVYVESGTTGGFTVTGSGSTDGESGVTGYTYPALGSGYANTNGDYTFDATAATQSASVTSQNGAGLSSTGTSFTAQVDSSAPTSSLTCNSNPCGAGWTTSVPVNIDITGDDGAGSGVQKVVYTTDGSDPTTSGTATTVNASVASFQLSTPSTITWYVVDNLGNASSVQSTTIQIDGTAPSAPTGFTFSATSHAYWPGSGTTVFFKGGGSGGFTIAGQGSTDPESGVSGYNYPALGSGWTNTGGDYTFDSTAGTQTGSVTAQNNAGLTSSGTSFTAQSDSAAPTSSIACNSAACSAGWYTSSPVAIDLTTGGESGASGVERIVYTTDGTDPAINGSDVVTNGTEV
ncbi:MAG TPA: chitobiase/beta-hexosaminidase C-terminal domain-containing protein, partial [Gaiellaceae bacterium]|nr:chitobiase/beta-hexosaminidase C-terminal domain-containing protein [Gaiellaceae bacterium]